MKQLFILMLVCFGFNSFGQSVTNQNSGVQYPLNFTPYAIINNKTGDTISWYWNENQTKQYIFEHPAGFNIMNHDLTADGSYTQNFASNGTIFDSLKSFKVTSDYFNFTNSDGWQLLGWGAYDSVNWNAVIAGYQVGSSQQAQFGIDNLVFTYQIADTVDNSYYNSLFAKDLYIDQYESTGVKRTQIYDGNDFAFVADGVAETQTVGYSTGMRTVWDQLSNTFKLKDNNNVDRIAVDPIDVYLTDPFGNGKINVGNDGAYSYALLSSNAQAVDVYNGVDFVCQSDTLASGDNTFDIFFTKIGSGTQSVFGIDSNGIKLPGGISFASIRTVNLSSNPDTVVLATSDYTIIANTGSLIISDTVAAVMPASPNQGKVIRISKTNADAVIAVLNNDLSLVGYIKSGSKYGEVDFDGSNWYLLNE